MFCRKCGVEIEDDSQFCKYCGTKINFVSAPQQQNKNLAPAASARQINTQKKRADFTPIEATVCAYIGSKSGFEFGNLGRNNDIM